MPERIPRLVWNSVTRDKLWYHGLTIDDVLDAARDRPILIHQEGKREEREDRTTRRRPDRQRLIGTDRGNRLLVIVIEYPDEDGRSHIVTGRRAGDRERAEYQQRRRRS